MANHGDDHGDDPRGADPLDRGLAFDLGTLARHTSRRELLQWLGGAGVLALAGGCGGDGGGGGPDAAGGPDGAGPGACAAIPEETAGPFPGDGSNGANALALSGVVRRDLRSSFAGATGTAEGVPLTVTLKLVDVNAGCAPLAGYAIYVWQCDREGRYSMYSAGVTDQNYLRGVQITDAAGEVTFTTIFPGCYPGRWPHLHFEVFPSEAAATSADGVVRTSQLALPAAACDEAYTAAGYAASAAALAPLSLETDGVFRDGASAQVAAVTGSAAAGFAAALDVGIRA